MDKRFRSVESVIHFWVLEEEKRQRESLSVSFLASPNANDSKFLSFPPRSLSSPRKRGSTLGVNSSGNPEVRTVSVGQNDKRKS